MESQSGHQPSKFRSLKLAGNMSVVALSALAFPSLLPWVIAFWLACHSLLAQRNRPAWTPLLICLLILVGKLVPATPAMIVFIVVLAAVTAIRFHFRREIGSRLRWWVSPLVLWILWVFVSSEWRAIERCSSPPPLVADRPIVCVGDSLTDGMYPDLGYPEQLKDLVSVPVINMGVSGISTVQGLAQMDRVLDHNPQTVIIELGGHDFLKGHSRAATKQNLVAMIDRCRSADAEVVLMEIPRGFIFDPYASVERQIAYEKDVQLVPDTWMRQLVILGPAFPLGMWFPQLRLSDDGIHSNPQGSEAIAKRVASALHQMYGDEIIADVK